MINFKKSKKGFTLVELTLAIASLSVLLLVIGLVTLTIINSYQKGLAIRAVSAVGRDLIDDLSRLIQDSPAKSPAHFCEDTITGASAKTRCRNNNANLFVYQQVTAVVNGQRVPVNGIFCTGRYSLIWNTGYTLDDRFHPGGSSFRASLHFNDGTVKDDFRFVSVYDPSRQLCSDHVDRNSYTYANNSSRIYRVPFIYNYGDRVSDSPGEVITLLDGTEDNLAVYDLEVYQPNMHELTDQFFYSIAFTLGTVQGGPDILANGDYCKTPEDVGTDFAYCAINKFNFAVRSQGFLNYQDRIEMQKNR